MPQPTRFLARLTGLFILVVEAAFVVRGSAVVELLLGDGAVLLVFAMIGVAVGLAMILAHNVWSGGVLPVVVTLTGWLIFMKGLLLLFLPPEMLASLLKQMQYGEHPYLCLAPSFALGLYLVWASFAAPTQNLRSGK